NVPTEKGNVQASWPLLYWGMTREILPLGSAYLAYQRLRAENMPMYRREVPDLQPFELKDLQYHMRVAGFPPPMRDFLVALSHPPLTRRDIQWAAQYQGKGKDWLVARYRDLGSTEENAGVQADNLLAREEERKFAWTEALARSSKISLIHTIEDLYEQGTISRPAALEQIFQAGIDQPLSAQLLDQVDIKVQMHLVKAAISGTRSGYLSGELSAEETVAQLGRIGILAPRASQYMVAWTIQRTRRRRQATTEKIAHWVATGRMDVATARRRLDNLGWTDPDLALQ